MRVKIPATGGPTADAGDDQEQSGVGVVTLDGSGSADYSTIAWTMEKTTLDGTTSDATSLLSSTTVVGPTFTPDNPGDTYIATITLDGSVSDSVKVSISAATTLNWSESTEHDPNSQESGGSTWGTTTATVVLDAVHGSWNGSDPYHRSWNIGTVPSGARALRLRLTFGASQPTANASGGFEQVHIAAATEVPLATNDGLGAAAHLNASNVWQNTTISRPGSAASGSATIGDPSGETIELIIAVTSGAFTKALATTKGATAERDVAYTGTVPPDTPTDVYVVAAFGLQASSPSAGQTFPMGQVTYEWLT